MEGMVVVQKQPKEIAREKSLGIIGKSRFKSKSGFIPLSTFLVVNSNVLPLLVVWYQKLQLSSG